MSQKQISALLKFFTDDSSSKTLLVGSPVFNALALLSLTICLVAFRKSSLYDKLLGASYSLWAKEAAHTHYAEDNNTSSNLNKDRSDGEWHPIKFDYPMFDAFTSKMADLPPVPYRPFKSGPYHVTMGLKSMPWDQWIEPDRDYEKYYTLKKHRIQIRGDKAVRVLSDEANPMVKGGAEAAVELAHELAEYLARRHPQDFTVIRHPSLPSETDAFCNWGWNNLSPIKTITVTSLGITHTLPLSVKDGEHAGNKAMEIAGLLVQDDLALMVEGSDGRYYFQAGSICLPGFWRLADKIGMPLDDIHLTGQVPQYKEKLQTSLGRWFRRLPVDKPVIRNNYFIQTNRREELREKGMEFDEKDEEELGWATSGMGEEDEFEHGTHGTAKPKGVEKLSPAKIEVDESPNGTPNVKTAS